MDFVKKNLYLMGYNTREDCVTKLKGMDDSDVTLISNGIKNHVIIIVNTLSHNISSYRLPLDIPFF